MGEDADGQLRIAQDVKDGQREGDDGRLVVLTSPEVQVVVGLRLNLSTPVEKPRLERVLPFEQDDQHIKEVRGTEPRFDRVPAFWDAALICRALEVVPP